MNSDFFIKNPSSKFVEITGKDRVDFLQGLITNDIFKCKTNIPIYASMLSPQGKFLFDFFIIYYQDKFLIEIHKKFVNAFINKLKIYKLRADVNVQQIENISSYIFFSNNVPFIKTTLISFNDPRNPNIGKKVLVENNEIQINNFEEKNFETYKEILIKNLIPYSVDDLIENKSLLLENNFDNINAISWDKGCYVGQEITARMKYRALLKKQIYNLKIISGEIKRGDEIILNKISVGKVISKVNEYILCMLKIEIAKEKSENKEEIKINHSTILKFL